MAIEYNFTLNMDRSRRDNNIAYARTGDVDSIVINADLVLDGSPYTPTGTNAFFECITPNGHSVRASASKTGSKVTAEIPSAAFQAAGIINVAYFRFESGSSDNPTYVESTEPFAIIVREGIGDNIDAGDYIEEWRQLADSLDEMVKEVQQKATQAEAAIIEQKEEVDDLKSQAQTAIAQDTVAVENAKTQAISDINATKAEVADAAADVTAAGDQAISQFKTNSQQAINSFNTNGTSAINQFNTNASSKLDQVDDMITEAQGDVDAKISQLETATDQAVSAMEDALDGTTAGSLQNAINRTLKLDVADMTNITNNASLSSFVNVGSYCCKTAAIAATISDCPVDDSPFNMYVFSSATSGQVMQLVVPIDLQGKPTAEWHVRFGTSSAMDKWSVIGGGADIAAGLGIDVTGDAQKTVALDTTAFYQHHEAASIIQGSTEVTGGGRFKELVVFGNTRQNLWVNPRTYTVSGITLIANDDGSVTISGTSTAPVAINVENVMILKPRTTYVFSVDKQTPSGARFRIGVNYDEGTYVESDASVDGATFTTPSVVYRAVFQLSVDSGVTVSGTYRVMLNEGREAQPWCPPGLNSVDELSLVTGGEHITCETHEVSSKYSQAASLPAPANECLKPGTRYALLIGVSSGVWYYNEHVFSASPPHRGAGTYALTITTKEELTDTTTLIKTATDDRCVVDYCYLVENPPATPIDLDGHKLNSLPDGTRDELTIDATGAVTLTKRVGAKVLPSDAESWKKDASAPSLRYSTSISPATVRSYVPGTVMSDALPPRISTDDAYGSTCIMAAWNDAYASIGSGETAQTIASVCGGKTLLYPLATPETIPLTAVTLPTLPSPNYTVFASSNVQAEIEADAVKVDYLHPSDVYTKEEVDKKIEDAGGMPDIVPVSQGGTGVTTAAAERNRLGLGNTTGAVPVANGGTGATTNKAAMYNVTSGMAEETSVPADDANVVFAYSSPSSGNGGIYKRKLQYIWSYIVTKIRSVFGFNSSNVLDVEHGGTGFNDFPAILVNLGSTSTASPYQAAPRPGVTGTLPVARGGTNATSAADARTNIAAAYGISSVQGSLSDSTKVTSDLSSSTNKNFTLSSLWSNWLEDKISTFLGSYGTFKKIYQNSDQSMTAQSNAVLQAFQNGKLLILVCRLYVPSYTTVIDYDSGTKTWTGPTFPTEIPTAMVPTSVLSDWNTLTPIYECGCYSAGGSSNWNNRKVLQQVKLASSGRGLTGAVNTFDTVATNKTPVQVWVNAYMFLVA